MERFFKTLIANEGRFPKEYRNRLHNLFTTAYSFKEEKVVRINVEAFGDYRYLVYKEKLKGIELVSKLAENGYEHEFTLILKPETFLAELSRYGEVVEYAA